MALQRTRLNIPLVKGIDDKVDPKQTAPGSVTTLDNVITDKFGEIRKRPGFDVLPTSILGGGSITAGEWGGNYENTLLLGDGNNLYRYSEDQTKWKSVGNLFNSRFSLSEIYNTEGRNSNSSLDPRGITVSELSGYIMFATVVGGNSNNLKIKVVDSDNVVVFETLIDAISSGGVRVKNDGSDIFYIVYNSNTSTIVYRKFTLSTLTLSSTVTAVSSGSPFLKDIDIGNGRLYILYSKLTTDAAYKYVILSSETLSGEVAFGIGRGISGGAIKVNPTTNDVWINYFSGTLLYTIIYNSSDTVALAETSMGVAGEFPVSYFTNSDTVQYVYYRKGTTVGGNTYYSTKSKFITVGGSVGSEVHIANGYVPVSKFLVVNSKNYLVVQREESDAASFPNQNTRLLIEITNDGTAASYRVVARILPDQGMPYFASGDDTTITSTQFPYQSEFVLHSDGRLLCAAPRISRFYTTFTASSVSFIQFITEFNLCFIELSRSNYLMGTVIDDKIYFNGGLPRIYDGGTCAEQGFNHYPQTLVVSATSTLNGTLSDGTYNVVALYEWYDQKGKVHRSSPSDPLSVVLSGGGSTQSYTLQVPRINATEKSQVRCVVYSTTNGGAVYYRTAQSFFDSATTDTFSITIRAGDAVLINGEPLYTDSGEIGNTPMKSYDQILPYNSGAVGIGLENLNAFEYTKPQNAQTALEYSAGNQIFTPTDAGELKSIGKLDEKLILFKENSIYFVVGDLPNSLGLGGSLTSPQFLTNDIGCEEPRSIVNIPSGLMFKSKKGFFILGRDFSWQYIGGAVEDYNNNTITGAVLIEERNEARFTTIEGVTLVYDYLFNKWETHSNQVSTSSTYVNGLFYFLKTSGEVWKETPAAWEDDSSVIKMTVETDWLNLADIQNYQRIYKVQVLGEYKSAHNLKATLYYDFDDSTAAEEITITPSASDAQYEYEFKPARQKCSSIKIKIEDVQTTAGEGLSLSNINIEVGLKPTSNKLPATRRLT